MFRWTVSLVLLAGAAAVAEPDVASFYEVTTEGTSASLKAGERGKVKIAIKLKGGAHVSDDAPLRIELSSRQGTLEKTRLTLADSLTRRTEGQADHAEPTFEVAFTPAAPGAATVEAKMTFFICTDTLCARQTKSLSIPVEVL